MLAKIERRIRHGKSAQCRALQHIKRRVNQVRQLHALRVRIAMNRLDPPQLVALHQVRILRVFVGMQKQRALCAARCVGAKHPLQVHIQHRVAIQHKEFFRQFVLRRNHCPGRTQHLRLFDEANLQPPARPIAAERPNLLRAVSAQQRRLLHAMARQQLKLVGKQRFAVHRHQRLGQTIGSRGQS